MPMSIKPNEIAVLILSTQSSAYAPFKEAIRSTWMRNLQEKGVHVYFYAGGYPRNQIVGDEIQLDSCDLLKATAQKLKYALKMLLCEHNNIKIIYRTNLSSYVDDSNFLKFISEKKLNEWTYTGLKGTTTYLREYFYGNRWLHFFFTLLPIGKIIKFASGSGFFLGVEYAKLLMDSSKGNELIDDVMVANVLGISPEESLEPARFDILDYDRHRISDLAYQELLEKHRLFHYRFKTLDRKKDAAMLKQFNDPVARYEHCVRNP